MKNIKCQYCEARFWRDGVILKATHKNFMICVKEMKNNKPIGRWKKCYMQLCDNHYWECVQEFYPSEYVGRNDDSKKR
jgi:hypothetical protein